MDFKKSISVFLYKLKWLFSIPVDWTGWYKVKEELRTPMDVWNYMNNNFKYKREEIDNIKPAPVMFQTKEGDCDDWGQFAYEILKHHNYNVSLLAIFTEKVGHAVCVIKEIDSTYSHISNWGYKTGYKSLEELYQSIYKDYRKLYHYGSNYDDIVYNIIRAIKK